jgi:ankyrin repeat protein
MSNSDISREESLNSQLIEAVANKDGELVQKLIQQGAEINCRDSSEDTPLLCAVKFGFLDITKILISYGANINVKDYCWDNALMIAIRYGYSEIALTLLENNITRFDKDNLGRTALELAIQWDMEQVVDKIVKKDSQTLRNLKDNADNNLEIQKITAIEGIALVKAIGANKTQIALSVIGNCSLEVLNNKFGETPLLKALEFSRIEIVERLIERGADTNVVDCNGNSPLMLACRLGSYQNVQLLINKLAPKDLERQLNKKNNDGYDIYKLCESKEIRALLIEAKETVANQKTINELVGENKEPFTPAKNPSTGSMGNIQDFKLPVGRFSLSEDIGGGPLEARNSLNSSTCSAKENVPVLGKESVEIEGFSE